VRRRAREDFYERLADRFEGLDRPADVRRRLRIVFDEALGSTPLGGARILDAGCGTDSSRPRPSRAAATS
jgi:hypothetical protein